MISPGNSTVCDPAVSLTLPFPVLGEGLVLVQFAWVLLLFTPTEWHLPGFVVLAVVELLVPVWAEQPSPTPWNVDHIRERYGLFTILLLGESILSTSPAIRSAADNNVQGIAFISIVLGGLLIVYAMWWLYFYQHIPQIMSSQRLAFIWAYGHFLIFGATAAVGAGLAVAVPSAVYVFSLWILQEHPRANHVVDILVHPVTVVLILPTPFTEQPVLFTGILLSILVAIRLVRHLEYPSGITPKCLSPEYVSLLQQLAITTLTYSS